MNFSDFRLTLAYSVNGERRVTSSSDENIAVDCVVSDGRFTAKIAPTGKVRLISAEFSAPYAMRDDEVFFGAGYQSWTVSSEYYARDRQKGLLFPVNLFAFARKISGASGDYSFTKYGKNLFHSHGYTYFRRGDEMEFFGSVDESRAFTVFYNDVKNGVFTISKDVEGMDVTTECTLFDIVRYVGGYDEVFDKYAAAYVFKRKSNIPDLAGYTSWYNYFQNIDENVILRDLNGMAKIAGDRANIFQIDDGYESRVGDWFDVDKKKFPHGMKYIADSIHSKGYIAGLWVAPFAAEYKSRIAEEHPDWLLRDEKGKKVIGGVAWKGFYVLDTEKPEVRDYVRRVFATVFDEWGYDMVKLDFLYAACIVPRNGKSRGQLMHEAMTLLRECVGDKYLLGCGVPMTSSFGFVDACRTGCDVELSFKDRYYVRCTNQEIISAVHAVNNTVFRRHLNKRFFLNDPDVFFLRDGGAKPAVYTMAQKKLLAKVNNMFGSVLFVSDNAAEYDAEKTAVLLEAFRPFGGKITRAYKTSADSYRVDYELDGDKRVFEFEMKNGNYSDKKVNG